MIYTISKAKKVEDWFRKEIAKSVVLIGSHSKGRSSKHDIDIYLSKVNVSPIIGRIIGKKLKCSSFEKTDWGGYFYHDTIFGEIDVFFKGQTKNFDY